MYDWVFLLLPQPEPGLAEQRVRAKWFGSQEIRDENALNDFLSQVGAGLDALPHHQRPLILTPDERVILAAKVGEWCNFPVKLNDDPFDTVDTRKALVGLHFILVEVDLSPAVAEELLTKSVALNQTDTPGFRLLGCLAKSLPDRFDDIAMSMRIGLTSDNLTVAEEAVAGLGVWLITSQKVASPVCAPPDDLCRELGVMIANRRKGALSAVLRLARWIFAEGSSAQRDAIAQLTLDGLRYLIEELRYDREHSEDNEVDVPLLRRGCAHLALAMSQVGYKTDPTVARWAQAVQDDPLPEVRHATRPVSVRSHGG